MNVFIEARKFLPAVSIVGATEQSADFNRSVNGRGVIWIEIDVLYVADVRRGRKAPFGNTRDRTKRRYVLPVEPEIISHKQMRRFGTGEHAHASIDAFCRYGIDIVLSHAVGARFPRLP